MRGERIEGFTANWSASALNRNYPQFWSDNQVTYQLSDSKFGVNLLIPIDDYQKAIRSAKYAILFIGLTFLVFFIIEVMNARRIHPIQYSLVGLALCLFYILLISISEHSNFNFSYLISSIVVVFMIGIYSLSAFKNKILSITLCALLIGLYTFLFVILQLVYYALIIGSIGLTIILGLTMYFTRNIDWYNYSGKLNVATSKN